MHPLLLFMLLFFSLFLTGLCLLSCFLKFSLTPSVSDDATLDESYCYSVKEQSTSSVKTESD